MLGTFVKQRRQSSERLLPASLWARRVHRPIRLFRSSFPGRDFGRPPLLPPFGLIIEALFPCGRFSPENELDEIDLLGHDHRVDYCRDNQRTDAPSSTDQVLLIGKAAQVNGRLLQSSLLPPGAIKNLVHVPLTNHAFIRYSLTVGDCLKTLCLWLRIEARYVLCRLALLLQCAPTANGKGHLQKTKRSQP